MLSMFEGCKYFNQPLNNWGKKVGRVENMSSMFEGCLKFDQFLGDWDVSTVKDMSCMFKTCISFNQPLNNWGKKVRLVTDMGAMFNSCSAFDQPLEEWELNWTVVKMTDMFYGCINFDQPMGAWIWALMTSSYCYYIKNPDLSCTVFTKGMFSGCRRLSTDTSHSKWCLYRNANGEYVDVTVRAREALPAETGFNEDDLKHLLSTMRLNNFEF